MKEKKFFFLRAIEGRFFGTVNKEEKKETISVYSSKSISSTLRGDDCNF